MHATVAPGDITLGLLAGGRATRLGGRDKAWMVRDGMPQVERWRRRFPGQTGPLLVSCNRDLARYAERGIPVVADITPGLGPLAGLEALADACATPWLFTLPVDLYDVNDCLLRTLLAARAPDGAHAVDEDGTQPLVALWRVAALRTAVAAMIAAGELSAQRLHARLETAAIRFDGVRFGNLNTPADLAEAGIDPESR